MKARILQFGAGIATIGAMSLVDVTAQADNPPKAEVMVIHATKCAQKSVDPKIGADVPPALGYDCLALVSKHSLPMNQNQAVTAPLPNNRTFQLVHTGMDAKRYKVTASVSPADGSAGFTKLADITAEPNKSFNVGGFAHQGGVIVVTVKIVP